jgi:hypothetical protein
VAACAPALAQGAAAACGWEFSDCNYPIAWWTASLMIVLGTVLSAREAGEIKSTKGWILWTLIGMAAAGLVYLLAWVVST